MGDSFNTAPRIWDWPDSTGSWWFYGYRYGKISCGSPCEKEIMLCGVCLIGGGKLMVTAAGQFMFENEVEEAMFIPATLPAIPPQ